MEEKANQVLLSFIVPCYNVEKYIQRCLDSIYACGLPEEQFEVVCINDCSPDNTIDILEQNRKSHDNLIVINHETNKGLGGGRNTGIKEAKGKFLWFIDSDDEIHGNGLVEALTKANREDLDMLCFNYCRINDEDKVLSHHLVFKETPVTDGCSFAKTSFSGGMVCHMGFVWRFLYRTEFLRSCKLSFPEREYWEDTVFMPQAILASKRIASLPHVMYGYRVNPNSISGVFNKAYPAKSIYDFAFCAGGNLLRFSEEVKDEDLKRDFHNTAINKYINGFIVHLFRTSRKERTVFYKMVSVHKKDLEPMKKVLRPFNKLILAIPLLSDCGSLVYKLKHRIKTKC